MYKYIPFLLVLALAAGCGPAPDQPDKRDPGADASLDALVDRYLERYWHDHPARATRAGVHDHDHRLRDLDQLSLATEAAHLKSVLAELDRIDPGMLNTDDHRVDHELLRMHAVVRLTELERFPRWQREPGMYLPFGELNALVTGDHAPPAARAAALASRLGAVPQVYAAGMDNLEDPPRKFTEDAIRTARNQLPFFTGAVHGFAETVPAHEDTLLAAAADAAAALEEYIRFLEQDLLQRSNGEIAVGEEMYEFYLREIHGLDLDADAMHELGQRYFREISAELEAQARNLDPDKDWLELTEDIRDDHPDRDGLLDAYCREIQRSRAHVIEHGLVTVPPNEEVRCIHSDPSQRAFSAFGVFSTPAPFSDDKVGYLILHPVPEGLSPEREEELLRAHDFTWIEVIAPHEAYPGHHLQALMAQENPRPLRKVYSTPVFTEGWGLYTEELMYETGFYTRPEETRLTQLRLRLWRAARVILDSGLHTGRMDYEDVRRFLADEVRMEYSATAGEANMYAYRPSYAVGYVVGYYKIMQLRERYREMMGDDFDLLEFHDRMLTLGSIPFPLVRKLLGLPPG